MAGTGFHSVVAIRAQMCTADCHEENNRAADCHSQESEFESTIAKGLFLLWRTAVHMRAICQGVILLWQTAVL
jgi:hypothetical protein